ncbi:MAG: hypothetical protein IJ071_12970 [Ruminococcus sp.]|nr:hypothetical protein [Ruminococcus sp.]
MRVPYDLKIPAEPLRAALFSKLMHRSPQQKARSFYITADNYVLCTSMAQRYAVKEEDHGE